MMNSTAAASVLRQTADELEGHPVTAEPPKGETVITRILRLYATATDAGTHGPQRSAIRGGRPLALVNFVHPETGQTLNLGVFWIGVDKKKQAAVGLRKLVKSGNLHRGHRRYAPAYWVPINELASHGNK